jgi:hypothetical protein
MVAELAKIFAVVDTIVSRSLAQGGPHAQAVRWSERYGLLTSKAASQAANNEDLVSSLRIVSARRAQTFHTALVFPTAME